MKRILCLVSFAAVLLSACSLPPEKPITIDELMQTNVFSQYGIEESPELVLEALNRDGEAVANGNIKVMGKSYPVFVKILATTRGLEVSHYDR